jgi:hypothetical protein
VGPRGRGIERPMIVGAGAVSSPAGGQSMDQMIWRLGQGQGSGSDASDESEAKKGKKRASVDSEMLVGYHQAAPLPTQMQYGQSSQGNMIGRARGREYGYEYGVEPAREAIEMPA